MSIHYSYYFDQICFAFQLREGLKTSPRWLADSPHPPLSPRHAIDVSRTCLSEMLKDYPGPSPKLSACSLIQQDFAKDTWYYIVRWWVYSLTEPGDIQGIDVPVFMSGECPSFEKFAYDDVLSAWNIRIE